MNVWRSILNCEVDNLQQQYGNQNTKNPELCPFVHGEPCTNIPAADAACRHQKTLRPANITGVDKNSHWQERSGDQQQILESIRMHKIEAKH